MSEPRLDLVKLLGSRRVSGALFTTFTLSLTWFEVYLLRQLERQGAQRVAVLADRMGVEMSLREGLASGPGIRYALEAIGMPKGVMHAKVALVWGSDHLLVAVGSGNLTLPGMQRNLEVWDVLTAGDGDTEPHEELTRAVAAGVSELLDSLHARMHYGAWARGVVAEAQEVLAAYRPRLPDRDWPRW